MLWIQRHDTMVPRLMSPLGVVLLVFVAGVAVVDGSFLDKIFHYETVCVPDFERCPNGGYAFRDRNHGCVFTPCEFVKPLQFAPPPLTISPNGGVNWLRVREFAVPVLRIAELRRGKRLKTRLARMLDHKRTRLQDRNVAVLGGLDVYIVDVRTDETLPFELNATKYHMELVHAAIDVTKYDSNETLAAVMHMPWSIFSFYGQVHAFPSASIVRTALALAPVAFSNTTIITEAMVRNTSTDIINMTTVLLEPPPAPQSSAVAPTGVLHQSELLSHCETFLLNAKAAQLTMSKYIQYLVPVNSSNASSVLVFVTRVASLVDVDMPIGNTIEWRYTLDHCDDDLTGVVGQHTNVTVPTAISTSNTRTLIMVPANETHSFDYQCSCWRSETNNATATTTNRAFWTHCREK